MTTTATSWIARELGDPDVLTEVSEPLAVPGPGQVSIDVRASGMNPADYKMFAAGYPGPVRELPVRPGYEIAGVISAVGPDTQIASGGGAVGDPVLAFRITGGYSSAVTISASDVFAKPAALSFPEAANLLLAGATAAEALDVTGLAAGETVLIHGGSGAVGIAATQLAVHLGARVISTASPARFDEVRRFGGDPVEYGPGREDRLRSLAPDGVDVAIDTVGTDEAIDVSLALVTDRSRIVTIASPRAESAGVRRIGGMMPASSAFRAAARPRLIALAAEGKLVIPVAREFPLGDVVEALDLLKSGHPGGKLALIP
ncbi:MAG TPA: NADP-dependent oxidoreductase [Galbitalea sp.]|nr:NADP-dependent oxidoreductase [Galbitalea sp.]